MKPERVTKAAAMACECDARAETKECQPLDVWPSYFGFALEGGAKILCLPLFCVLGPDAAFAFAEFKIGIIERRRRARFKRQNKGCKDLVL